MAIVLFIDDQPLLVSEIERGGDGCIRFAFVENGAWFLRIADGIWTTHRCADGAEATAGKYKTLREVQVERGANYNETIDRAMSI